MKISSYICISALLILFSCNRPRVNPTLSGYQERNKCKSCHEEIFDAYTNSHHDLAMEIASKHSVLGNFDTLITHLGDAARFYTKNDEYFVYTKADDGIYKDLKVAYTFGWTPLQQYLIEFPNGAYQVLPFCWDSRPKEEGGQKWFHIYDQEKIEHNDVLYWTGKQQNWNHVCAECHSTDLHKNYNVDSLSFFTSWNEIDVSCDACHGPSENHLKWAKLDEQNRNTGKYPNMGYHFRFPRDSAQWVMDEETGTAYRSPKRTNHQELNICARCHSRRLQIWDDYIHGEDFLQTHLPEVLEPRLYYVDGQIKEEDYVYGSFIQSKMYKHGVTCTDCHDPHSYQIKAPGNTVCLQCHTHAKNNNKKHHFHENEANGGSCRECHMPTTVYMVNDPRYDHSFRIPRPDLSLKIGVPNACNNCHSDKSNDWADEWFRKWYGNKYDTIDHYGIAFHAAYNQKDGALNKLIDVLADTANTDIVRASAIHYLQYIPSSRAIDVVKKFTNDRSALVRLSAIRVLAQLSAANASGAVVKMMNDSIRAVRYEASNAFVQIPQSQFSRMQTKIVTRAMIDEYIKMLYTNNDQAASHLNLGLYYINKGFPDSALICYQRALAVDSTAVEASINMADLYRQSGRDDKGEIILLNTLDKNPGRPEVYNTLGLLYTRQGKTDKAMAMFSKAYDLASDNTYYIYVYSIALNSAGNTSEAIRLLEEGYEINRYDQNILYALTTLHRDLGNKEKAGYYYSKLQTLVGE